MIDIPLDKILLPIEMPSEKDCAKCRFYSMRHCYKHIACFPNNRRDGKSVIFKLVDRPEVEK